MSFKPSPCRSRWEGLAVTSWIVLIDVLLGLWIGRRPVDPLSFLLVLLILTSLPLFVWLAYRTWGAFNLIYWLDRDALHIRWAADEQLVPLSDIRRVVHGGKEIEAESRRLWPSPFVRSGRLGKRGAVQWFATRSLPDCLLLETDHVTFALSPMGAERFIKALQEYNRLGPLRPVFAQRHRPKICGQDVALYTVPGRWLLLMGGLGVLSLFGLLMVAYPSLPDRLIFHFNSAGMPDSIRPKRALFLLPSIGLLTFLVNGAGGLWMSCRQQRLGAYLLWGGSVSVQILVLLALVALIG